MIGCGSVERIAHDKGSFVLVGQVALDKSCMSSVERMDLDKGSYVLVGQVALDELHELGRAHGSRQERMRLGWCMAQMLGVVRIERAKRAHAQTLKSRVTSGMED